jgi:hypothetical protein
MHLAVDGDNALDGFGELCHEPLEHGGELLGVEQAEQAAEGVVAPLKTVAASPVVSPSVVLLWAMLT